MKKKNHRASIRSSVTGSQDSYNMTAIKITQTSTIIFLVNVGSLLLLERVVRESPWKKKPKSVQSVRKENRHQGKFQKFPAIFQEYLIEYYKYSIKYSWNNA